MNIRLSREGHLRRRRSTMLAAGVIFTALTSIGFFGARLTPLAAAQNMGERIVSGTVLNASSEAVSGATVFLKNERTKSIRSFTSLPNGHFQFSQVDKDQDFDLWAEKNGHKSAVKTVSSWDSRSNFVSDLKLK